VTLLRRKGLMLKEGTMVDATIIEAPTSTQNKTGERDPEMHQTKKGNDWHFGMKAHIGADVESGLTHSLVTTPANESDVAQIADPLHGREKVVHGDGGYVGAEQYVDRAKLQWKIARRQSTVVKIKRARDRARAMRLETWTAFRIGTKSVALLVCSHAPPRIQAANVFRPAASGQTKPCVRQRRRTCRRLSVTSRS
jgi:IS5 family transposase